MISRNLGIAEYKDYSDAKAKLVGGKKGKYELAVLDKNGDLCYDTPITSDVIGYLTMSEAEKVLINISHLEAI